MKTVASIENIRAEIQRRIETSTWGNGCCTACTAPVPYRVLHDGVANWTANAATAKPGCEGFLLEITATIRRDYDLPPQSLGDAISDLLSWRQSPV